MGSVYLIDQDLKDIGVLLGHRQRCCARLAKLPLRRRHRRNVPPQRSRNLRILLSDVKSL
jgi:hypothetical protein